jgi:cytochrome c biogenesis protein CcdA
MVGTIGPLVKVAAAEWLMASGSYVLGSVLGGALIGSALGMFGSLVLGASALNALNGVVVLFVAGVVAVARDAGFVRLEGPSFKRSVPKSWHYALGRRIAPAAYGFVLGLGITTTVPVAAYYWLLFWVFAAADPLYGAITMAAYGLGRFVPVLIATPLLARGIPTQEVLLWIQSRGLAGNLVAAAALTMWLANVALLVVQANS